MKSAEILVGATLTFGAVVAVPADQVTSESVAVDEGLKPVKITGLDHVSARPGIDLSVYHKVMLEPVDLRRYQTDRVGGTCLIVRAGIADVRLAVLNAEHGCLGCPEPRISDDRPA